MLLSFLVAGVVIAPVAAERAPNAPLDRQAPTPTPTPLVTPQPAPQPAPAQPAAPQPQAAEPAPGNAPVIGGKPLRPNEVLLNFQGADIQAVVKAVSQMTGRNFLIDPRVKGEISIISSKPVSTSMAYQIFISALKAQGFAVIEGPGNLVKLVPTGEARHFAPVYSGDESPRGGEQMVTHVVIVQNGSAAQMIPLLRPLMAPTSQLSSFDPANALILTDFADNIRRMVAIIEKVDKPASADVNIITLQYASALDIADLLSRLSLPGISGQQPGVPMMPGNDRFTIVPDMRTNSLLVRADNPGRVTQLRSLVEKLDVPAMVGGSTRVIYLKNADATKLADVLRGLVAGEQRAQTSATMSAPPGGNMRGAIPAVAQSRPGEVSLIQADESTNALIINASDAVYNNLRAVIEKLDVRLAQVYVEALIVEMSSTDALELGVQWAGANDNNGSGVFGMQNLPNTKQPGIIAASIPSATTPLAGIASSTGLTLGYWKEVTIAGQTIIGLGGLIRALQDGGIGNILSTPNIITLDNAEAKIVVGKNVPFVTGSFTSTGATTTPANPFQTIERKDVGITLKIKPQISEGGTIKLEIFQEVSTISTTLVSGATDLVTDKRSIETKVVVDDGDTIVLGGLIEDQTNEVDQAVPILGKIPLLGALFRYRSTTKTKRNLLVFLRPVVLRGSDDSYRVTADRYDYLRRSVKDKTVADELDRLAPKKPVPKLDEPLGPTNVPAEFGQ